MNKRAKGKKIELEFCKLLLKNRAMINRACPGTKWNRGTDLWDGRFDVEAILAKFPNLLCLFQISTRWKTGKERAHIEDFPSSPYRRIFMVRRKDNHPFEVKEWVGGEWMDFELYRLLGIRNRW